MLAPSDLTFVFPCGGGEIFRVPICLMRLDSVSQRLCGLSQRCRVARVVLLLCLSSSPAAGFSSLSSLFLGLVCVLFAAVFPRFATCSACWLTPTGFRLWLLQPSCSGYAHALRPRIDAVCDCCPAIGHGTSALPVSLCPRAEYCRLLSACAACRLAHWWHSLARCRSFALLQPGVLLPSPVVIEA